MNKDKFFKFFEIAKLDKGLFRIWIILSVLWFIIFPFILDDHEFREYQESKKYINKPNVYCEELEEKQIIWRKNEITGFSELDGIRKTGRNVYGYGTTSILLSPDGGHLGRFRSLAECTNFYKEEKSKAFVNLIPLFIFYFLTPFLVALIYLFSKKVFLWIRQGFK